MTIVTRLSYFLTLDTGTANTCHLAHQECKVWGLFAADTTSGICLLHAGHHLFLRNVCTLAQKCMDMNSTIFHFYITGILHWIQCKICRKYTSIVLSAMSSKIQEELEWMYSHSEINVCSVLTHLSYQASCFSPVVIFKWQEAAYKDISTLKTYYK